MRGLRPALAIIAIWRYKLQRMPGVDFAASLLAH
jgi:hypothetical protein